MTNSKRSPTISPDLIWRLVDGDAVVVSSRTGKVRVLNDVGTVIWQLLAEEIEVKEIETRLTGHFNVSREQAHRDLAAFLKQLGELDLIV